MTLGELKTREDMVKAVVDRWDDLDRTVAYAYLHRGYNIRISECERTLAKALLGENRDGNKSR